MASVGIPKHNGKVEAGQFLTAHLSHLVVDAGGVDVSTTGHVLGVKSAGEELFELISDVMNPVMIEPASATSWFIAAETNGLDADDIAAAINASPTFGAATVEFGTYTVTVV